MLAPAAGSPPPTPTPSPSERIARLEKTLDVAPENDGVYYGLARALAAAGRHADAIRALEKAVALGGDFDLSREAAFAPLRRFETYRELARALARRAPVRRSALAFRLAEKDLVTEGLAYDPADRTFYAGTLSGRSILRIDRTGRESVFVPPAAGGLWAVLGLRVDPERRLLWAAAAADGREGALRGSSSLSAFDLATGTSRGRWVLSNSPHPHLLNDLALAGGDVYATDSESGEVWRLGKDLRRLETFLPAKTFVYPNGIALDAAGRRLYVADFARGLSVVDLATRRVRALAHPRGVSLHGIDGLYARGARDLLAIQNGSGLERVVSFRLDASGETVASATMLESRNPDFDAPTTGAIVDGAFYYLANSQVQKLDDDGKLVPGARIAPILILRLPLAAGLGSSIAIPEGREPDDPVGRRNPKEAPAQVQISQGVDLTRRPSRADRP